MSKINEFLKSRFYCGLATYPLEWADYMKDQACIEYIKDQPLDNILCDIREQIDDESLCQIFVNPIEFRNIVYLRIEQKLIDWVDKYNQQISAGFDALVVNYNRARDDAGHSDRDFA